MASTNTNPKISVVVSTLGNYDGLCKVLDRLEHQTAGRDTFEVIVAMDCADPDPREVSNAIGSRPYDVSRTSGSRPGLSANRNAGLAKASASLILYTDNDTLSEPALVAEHLAWHERHPEEHVAILGHVRWASEIEVTPFMHWLDHGVQFDYPNITGIDAGWGRFYGANVSVKRAFVERVGGFDEERFPYLYDDLDFAYRANRLGLQLLYNRAAVVEHLREVDLDFWRSKVGRLARVERKFVEVHPDVPPYFHRMFEGAARSPAASGRGRHLIKHVPRGTPLLGERIWRSAAMYYKQQIAPDFLEAWESDEPANPSDGPIAPYLLDEDRRDR